MSRLAFFGFLRSLSLACYCPLFQKVAISPKSLNYPCAGKEVEFVILFDLEYRGVAHDHEFHRSDNHFDSTELSQETTRA
jgi:hypothetical protein